MRFRLLALILAFSMLHAARAQPALPLIIHIDGQVYRWLPGESEPAPTGCDLQGNVLRQRRTSLTLSPTGEWAAMMVLPVGGEEGGPTPSGNLWLCNVETGAAYALSDQRPQQVGMVSEGIFSPDGTRIVWTEIVDYETSHVTMFVHDLASGETLAFVDPIRLDEYCGAGSYARSVIWGKHGIGLAYSILDGEFCEPYEDYGLSYYAEDGTLINSFLVSRQSPGNARWLDTDEPRIVYLQRSETMPEPQLSSINMLTGEVREESGTLEAFISTDSSAAVTLSMFEYRFESVQITLPGTDAALVTETDVAFSPDGASMAMILGRTVYFSENGSLVPAPWNMNAFPIAVEGGELILPPLDTGQFEVAWAEPVYRLVPEPETECPGAAPLSFDGEANVVAGLGDNNVREAPLANAQIVGTLPEGAPVAVIPDIESYRPRVEICSGGVRWREIFFEGRLAWTAESKGSTYYLED